MNDTPPPTIPGKLAALEAILFIHGESLQLKKVAAALGAEKEELREALEVLKRELQSDERGLFLLSDAPIETIFSAPDWESKKIQLATKPAFSGILEQFVKEELREDLSPASLEALSLIAYLGPVSRSEIDYIRGVNSSFILRNLALRGLIERIPHPSHAGSFLYKPTFDFMRHLGVSSREELPDYEKFRSLTEVAKAEEGQPKES